MLDCMFEVAEWYRRKSWGEEWGPSRGHMVPRVEDRRLRNGRSAGKGY